MASRRLALMAATHGPWVSLARITEPFLRVRGLGSGTLEASVLCQHCAVPFLWLIEADGDYSMFEHSEAMTKAVPEWIKLEANRPGRALICEVISKVA